MFGSEKVEQLIEEIEREYCTCGAGERGLEKTMPKTREFCNIHERCKALRTSFHDSQPIY